jgi:1,4-alpha-glucan branching enzyme
VLAQPAAVEAALAVTLLAPAPPLMFMGDEWGTRRPFPFFCDFTGELAEAVRAGRRKEFAEAYAQQHDEIPDPLAKQTVFRATLDWAAIDRPPHAGRLDLVKRLLAARKTFVIPRLPQLRPGPGSAKFDGTVLTARWAFDQGETLALVANLGGRPQPRPETFRPGEPVWGGAPPDLLPPWSVYAAIEAR